MRIAGFFMSLCVAVLLLPLAGCGSSQDRIDREGAALNNGTASPELLKRHAAAQADILRLEAEAQTATVQPFIDPEYVALLEPPPPVSFSGPDRAEIEAHMAAEPCRPDISAADCAQARAALVTDFDSMVQDQVRACPEMRKQILQRQQQLHDRVDNVVAFESGRAPTELASGLALARSEFAKSCITPGTVDAAAEAYWDRQRQKVRRVF